VASPVPMPMCPMATVCRGMLERPTSRFVMTIPGIVFVVLGITVFIEPRILAWLVAVAFIVMGIIMLIVTLFMRRVGGSRAVKSNYASVPR
jgi:uncharacterized membrane protein HdeD (DUF308 family)